MGLRGVLPQPDNIRELRGNPGKRKPLPTVKARPGIPTKPARIKGEALREWNRITPELEATGRLAFLDRAMLTLYCRTWARWCELDDLIGTDYLNDDDRGVMRKHTAWPLLRETARDVIALAKELGLSPNARLRMPVNEGDGNGGDSPFD